LPPKAAPGANTLTLRLAVRGQTRTNPEELIGAPISAMFHHGAFADPWDAGFTAQEMNTKAEITL